MAEMTGMTPNPLFLERMNRLQTAVACGTPDRVPLSLVMDTFAAKTMGVKFCDFATDVDRGRLGPCWPHWRSWVTSTLSSSPPTPRPCSACSGWRP